MGVKAEEKPGGNDAILIHIRVVKSGTSDGLYALLDTNNTGFFSTPAANY